MEGSIELSNVNNFNNYFRGVYFKAELNSVDGSLVFFDIADANITLHYSFDKIDTLDEDEDDDTTDLVKDTGELALNFSNNIVNGINTDFNATIEDELADQDEINGKIICILKEEKDHTPL